MSSIIEVPSKQSLLQDNRVTILKKSIYSKRMACCRPMDLQVLECEKSLQYINEVIWILAVLA
jgi:hypothetical protein